MENHHLVVAVEHLAAPALVLALMAGQPVVGPALVLAAGHGSFELIELLGDCCGDQRQLLFG